MSFEPLTPERRRAMTRQHLLDAAAIVFARDGFHGATIDKIAERAGFTKGAVYSNFKSKDDLFLALLDQRATREHVVMEMALERTEEDTSTRRTDVEELLRAGSAFWDDEFTTLFLEFLLYARRNDEAREKLVAQLRHEIDLAEDLIRHEYDVMGADPPHPIRALAIASSALYQGLQLRLLIDPEEMDQQVIDTAFEMSWAVMSTDDPPAQRA